MSKNATYSEENPEGTPWTYVSKKEILDNQFINHSQHTLLNLAGSHVEYTLVHFKNKAVGVAPYQDGYVYLVGQYRYAINQYSWELPEGGCPPGHETLAAAKWELAEETGLRAESFEPFIEMHTSNGITDEWAIVYLATGLSQGDSAPDENEVLQTRKVSVDELLELVEAQKVTDAMTVATAYKLAMLKAQGKLPQ